MEQRRLLEFRKPRTGELLSFKTRQYYVSEDGQVYDGKRRRFMAQCANKNGYMAVALTSDSGSRHTSILVHNLVATCFLRLLERGENVHHKNHDRQDNNLSNLEIINAKEHQRQHTIEKWASGTFDVVGEKVAAKLRNVGSDYRPAKRVAQIDKNGKLIKVWPSTKECGRNGYDFSSVAHCCRGCYNRQGNNVYKGFKWMWYEDYQKELKEEAQLQLLSFSE